MSSGRITTAKHGQQFPISWAAQKLLRRSNWLYSPLIHLLGLTLMSGRQPIRSWSISAPMLYLKLGGIVQYSPNMVRRSFAATSASWISAFTWGPILKMLELTFCSRPADNDLHPLFCILHYQPTLKAKSWYCFIFFLLRPAHRDHWVNRKAGNQIHCEWVYFPLKVQRIINSVGLTFAMKDEEVLDRAASMDWYAFMILRAAIFCMFTRLRTS